MNRYQKSPLQLAFVASAVLSVVGVFNNSAAFGQTLTLTELTRFNLNAAVLAATGTAANPNYIGNNPSAVAWNGSRLFVAGINNGATGTNSQNTGVIEVLNTNTTGIVFSTAVQYGTRFGFLATPNQRGYSGLAMQGSRLFAAFDTGSVQVNALRGYDIATQTTGTLWSDSGRGGAGVAIDPGYVVSGSSQGGSGVGWGTFGDGIAGSSTRRGLNDPATGASIYGFNSGTSAPVPAGFIWNTGGLPRDLSFDPDTGDLYGRASNAVWKAVRSGSNSAGTPSAIFDAGDATITTGQNIAFMSNTSAAGDLLAFNLKDGFSGGTFQDYVRLSDTSGAVQSTTWNFLGGTSPTSTNGYYDFAYDITSQTLAVVDASNLRVSIFGFGAPAPDTQLTWAADGVNSGGTGTWDTSSTTWIGAYGPSVWQPQANALFSGTSGGTVTVAAGGVSIGRGLSFSANGYTVAGAAISLTGTTASTNNLFVGTGLSATVNANLAATSGLSKSGSGTLVVGGTISGGNVVVENGTLTLAAANTYTGTTVVSGGTLALQGAGRIGTGGLNLGTTGSSGAVDLTALTAGTYSLPSTGNLAGVGTITGNGKTLAVLGSMAPGNSAGTITVGTGLSLNLSNSGSSVFEITSPAFTAGTFDLVNGAGSVVFGGILNLAFSGGAYAEGTDVLQLFANTGGRSGNFSAVHATGLAAGQSASFNPATGFITVVPEPSTCASLLAGLAFGCYTIFRRRRAR
jgi:autotransporter-associated beta strand protein